MTGPAAGVVVVVVRDGAEVASWPVERDDRPALAVVEELARLQLGARRLGCSIEVRTACGDVLELLELAGLGEVVRAARDWY